MNLRPPLIEPCHGAHWKQPLRLLLVVLFCATGFAGEVYTIDEAVAVAVERNRDIEIARARLSGAQGEIIEANAGRLPALVSSGLYRHRERAENSRLRPEDYNASLRVVQNVYTGGRVAAELAIARLKREKQRLELASVMARVEMDVRVAFNEALLNRARVGVREQSLAVLRQELTTQQERFSAGTVGELNVRRAEVALATEEPQLIDARKQLELSHLQLAELFGMDSSDAATMRRFELRGALNYRVARVDLTSSLARAVVERPEVRLREIDVAIEDHQLVIDRSELRPQVDAFAGYELYSERDPDIGDQFNHGYVIGLNASWKVFDGFATKGRIRATEARREAAALALASAKLAVQSEVRSAFLDLQQAERSLVAETRNVELAAESLELARANSSVGLGTQLDVLQAATDITRARGARLSAIYLHHAALARLTRATGGASGAIFDREVQRITGDRKSTDLHLLQLARPPARLKKGP